MKVQEEQKEPQSMPYDDDIAPLSQDYFNNNDRYLDIDIGVFDYVFKCVDGPYTGKFFYINTSPHGEIIGGKPDYDMQRNPDKLTMFIENSQLSSKHALITLNSHCQYQIQDLSPDNSSGVWIKIPTSGEGLDLYRNRNNQRKYMINNFQYLFEFSEDDQVLLDLFHWLRINQLDHAYQLFQQEGITNFGSYFSQVKDFLDKYHLKKDFVQSLMMHTKDLKNTLQYLCGNGVIRNSDLLFEKKHLSCTFTSGAPIQFQLDGYQGYLIGGPQTKNANIKISDENLNDMYLYIIFKLGSYFIVGDHSESNIEESFRSTNPFFNLFKNEKFHIHPGYVINMGLLSYQVERFNTGVIADVGTRGSMEDTYLISQDIGIDEYLKVSLFSVIDGHGGDHCAIFIRQRLEQEIRKELTDPDLGLKSKGREGANECITNALRRAFLNLDEQFYQEQTKEAIKCGAAVVCVLIVGNRVFCANVGDSRATRQDEVDRVKENGGMINCGRVQNKLAITRAFGDFEFKTVHIEDRIERRTYLVAEPEIRMMDIDPFIDDFIVIGSDGLYDKFSSQEVINFIRTKLGNMPFMEQDVCRVAREITSECILAKHVKDNVTVIIIALNRGVKLN